MCFVKKLRIVILAALVASFGLNGCVFGMQQNRCELDHPLFGSFPRYLICSANHIKGFIDFCRNYPDWAKKENKNRPENLEKLWVKENKTIEENITLEICAILQELKDNPLTKADIAALAVFAIFLAPGILTFNAIDHLNNLPNDAIDCLNSITNNTIDCLRGNQKYKTYLDEHKDIAKLYHLPKYKKLKKRC